MTARNRLLLFSAAAAVAVIAAYHLGGFVAVDACLDWGGRVLREPLRCEVAEGQLRGLTDLRRSPGWWLFAGLPGISLGALVYLAGRRAFRWSAGSAG